MNTKLKAYFPMIRTREEILRDIQQNINLTERFYSWKEEQREEFMDFCTGVKGVKMLYDAFFKEIMNPETVPERLEDFLEVFLPRYILSFLYYYPLAQYRHYNYNLIWEYLHLL